MLDDFETISKIDKSKMLEAISRFPEQIKQIVEMLNSTDIKSFLKIDNIIMCGMGGSAISGDIIKILYRDKLDIPIIVNRGYDLPKWANKNTLVICQSYSGNTEETLKALKHASQKKCKIIGISSGGQLMEYCRKRDVSHIRIPFGFVPRAAIAYLLFSSILALKKSGLLKNNIEQEIEETIILTRELRDHNNLNVPEKDNFSKQIARNILGKIPQIYGWGIYAPIAKRWCTQLNENSKIIARYDTVPECNHNDIVGWANDLEISKKFSCILFRDEKVESVYMSRRLDFMRALFKDVAGDVFEIQVKGKKKLPKMMYALYLGDFVSYYLALLRKVDPTPVDVIDELKRVMAEI